MKFEDALKAMREGKKVKTTYSPNLWLENEEIWYKCKQGIFNYPLSTQDILAEDWEVVDE